MKNTLIAAGIIAAASQAMATISIANPWGQVSWTAGGTGEITWTATSPDDTMNCDIQLLNGDATHSNLVARITAEDTPVPCSLGKFDIYPLNDFASGQYSIRIGQRATDTWYYSGLFTFTGNGSVGPVSTAWTASTAPDVSASAAPDASSTAAAAPEPTVAAQESSSEAKSGSKPDTEKSDSPAPTADAPEVSSAGDTPASDVTVTLAKAYVETSGANNIKSGAALALGAIAAAAMTL